ncbi:MAG: PAS domain S-box protein [Desulfobacterales bacterium]|nr:PAS domain S-box protein [Desulfobacterales bacterium]
MMISLDIRTMSIVLALIVTALGLSMMSYAVSRKVYAGFVKWTIGYILIGLGALLIGLLDVLPEFLTIIMSIILLIFFVTGLKHLHTEMLEHELNNDNEKLVESEERYRNLIENSLQGLIIFNDNPLRISFASKPMESITGYSKKELENFQSQQLTELIHPDDRNMLFENLKGLFSNQDISSVHEYRIIHKTKGVQWIETYSLPISQKDSLAIHTVVLDITKRKEAQEALKERERRFRNVLEDINLIGIMLDPKGNITFCNKFFLNLTGLKQDDVVGQNWFEEFLPNPDKRICNELFLKSIETGTIETHYENQICFQNNERTIAWNNTLHKDKHGNVIEVTSIGEDITDRKASEQTLRENEFNMRTILDTVQAGIMLIDTQTHQIIDINIAGEEMMGLPKEQILGMTCHNFVCPANVCSCPILDLNQTIDNSERILLSVKGKRTILKSVVPLIRNNRRLLLETFVDITERKEKELELQKFKRSVENSPLSIVITNTEGFIEYVNPAFSQITGYSNEEALGQNPRILKSGMHNAEYYKELWETITAGKTWRSEMCNRKKNGILFWEQASISPVRNHNGNIVNYVAIKEVITDRKELEQLKEDVNRIMRHDLTQPITAIIGYSNLLQLKGNLNESQINTVKKIEESAIRMTKMIDMSLDMFKMETGTYNYLPQKIDSIAVVLQIIEHNSSKLSKKHLHSTFWVNGQPAQQNETLMVWSEERLLYSLLSNLVTNAIDASPEGEGISIDISDSESIIITIRNRGAVPKPIRDYFFEKYKTYGKKKGTGLGTYSAKLLSNAMDYAIRMETSDEDDSTCISVYIPKERLK